MTIFVKCEEFVLTWTGYGDDVIGHDRKLKNELPNTNFPQITMQKELGRYLLPVFRKKYKTVRHLKNIHLRYSKIHLRMPTHRA